MVHLHSATTCCRCRGSCRSRPWGEQIYMTLIVELMGEKILWRNLSQWPLDSLAKSMYHQVRAMK